MSTLNDIGSNFKRIASKAVSRTGDITDTASLHVKLARKEADLATLYEQFGRVAYQKIKVGSSADHKMKILIEKIDIVRSEIHSIKRLINQKKSDLEFEVFNAIETEKAIERAERMARQHLNN